MTSTPFIVALSFPSAQSPELALPCSLQMGEVQDTKRATMNKLHKRIKVQHGRRPGRA